MNELRSRGIVMMVLMGLVFLVYIGRLFYLQVISEKYSLKSEELDMQEQVLLPSRGIIFDRNENIFVKNEPLYDLLFIPKELSIPDTTILEDYLNISREEIRSRIKEKNRGIERYQTHVFERQVDFETMARFQEQMWQFEGISFQARNKRTYPYDAGACFLGYISEVKPSDLDRDPDDYYAQGDLIGTSGIERYYERELRGQKGNQTILVDAFKRKVGPYAGGEYDTPPVEGGDLQLGIDGDLQVLGEQLMQGKRGSIVAIEPASGEILAFVSAPTYDPNLFTGRELGMYYQQLANDSLNPLFNRPLMAMYPPGSIFKMLQALAAMSEGIVDENTHYACAGAWRRNGGRPKCHGAHGYCSLHNAIKHSCNAYFSETQYQFLEHKKFGDIHPAFNRWREIMKTYGIGQRLGVDVPNEKPGNLPTSEFYDKIYGKTGWRALTIYSNSIGQGEILMTPLQMANISAMIANRGWYYPPHFVRAITDSTGELQEKPYERIEVPGQPEHYEIVVNGMEEVVTAGTATRARIDSIAVCGKTGTVENKPYKDHSVFMAFAPKENPQIAIAVIVENAGFGGTWAAPISSLMIEHYLTGKIKNQYKLQRILDANFTQTPTVLAQH